MSKSQVNKNRKIGALVAYTTLACSLVSLGVYVYRQQHQKGAGGSSNSRRSNGTVDSRDNRSSLDHNGRPSLDNNSSATGSRQDDARSSEPQASSLSRLGSKIARTVKRNRKVMTISLKNTIVWNPSPDPTTPNYGFVEGAIPLLFHLAETYNLHLILLCPALPSTSQHQNQPNQQANGKGRVMTVQEQEEAKRQQQLGQERERDQILTMLGNAGLISPVGTRGPKLIDPRQLLICETEEGVSHVVRHLESQVHVEAKQSVVELVQGVVPKVVFVQKKPGHSRTSSISQQQQHTQEQDGDIMTRSHIRSSSSSRSSSSTSSSLPPRRSDEEGVSPSADLGASSVLNGQQQMGDSFVEVFKAPQHEPLVSGYVTQAGKKGYVEVTDQLMRSSLNPEYSN
ncbi:hypothetical protein BG015_003444 [Linnemannia schmuckeri]|uniref:Uncharacterized protein n=1 Tax=Linnemannia schmuckeri TaxID=64567 RepID=A0A9P5S531_9FUNG|nr:hypothetical protein BG015_003444 [Linnemannia schmuckeri]